MSTSPADPPDDPEMECFNLDCGWHGPLSECMYIANVSPHTCPQCRETTAVRAMSTPPLNPPPPDDQIWLAAATQAQAGWQLVPTEPTDSMLQVMRECESENRTYSMNEAWQAMLAAAPSAPTPMPDPPDAQERITLLRAALNNIAYSRWSTEPAGQFVEVLQKMARDALIANASARRAKDRLAQPAPGTPSPAPALPVVWQETTADGEPMWNYDNFLSTPEHFDYSRPLYANPVQATPTPAPQSAPSAGETRSQKLAAAGHVRRPSWHSLPPDDDTTPAPADDVRIALAECVAFLRAHGFDEPEAARLALEGKT